MNLRDLSVELRASESAVRRVLVRLGLLHAKHGGTFEKSLRGHAYSEGAGWASSVVDLIDSAMAEEVAAKDESKSTSTCRCSNCRKTKSSSHFFKSRRRPGEWSKWCRACLNELTTTRQCGRCKKAKPTTAFFSSRRRPGTPTKWCKTCLKTNRT